MLQRWTDHEDIEHRVRDDYERNRTLIDLTCQPDEIKAACKQIVSEAVNKDKVQQGKIKHILLAIVDIVTAVVQLILAIVYAIFLFFQFIYLLLTKGPVK